MTGGDEPTMLGPYELRALLGRGGMGEVWRAYDTRREREVALKLMASDLASDEGFVARFRREAQVTARLSSVHVIPIHDYGEVDGRLFVDMRLVAGRDLAALLDGYPYGLGHDRASAITAQIADALDAAHAAGLVHRDVKPSNVLVDRSRGRDFCYLVDFGIAKLVRETTSDRITRTGATLGTPSYMAPELFTGSGEATAASDAYALGCVLFEMLTGRTPFVGPTPGAVLLAHVHQPPPAPSSYVKDLAAFDAVVATALAKDPKSRFPSARTLVEALPAETGLPAAGRPGGAGDTAPPRWERWADPTIPPAPTGTPAGPDTLGVPAPETTVLPRRRRRRWQAVVLAAVILVGGGAAGVYAATRGGAPAVPVAAAPAAVPGPPRVLGVSALPISPEAPFGIAVGPDGRSTYVVNIGSTGAPNGLVSRIDPASGAPGATVRVGLAPQLIVVSPDGRRAYVSIGNDDHPGSTVDVVDTGTNSVLRSVKVGAGPSGLALSPDGRSLYVANQGTTAAQGGTVPPGRTVSVVDTATGVVRATVPVGPVPSRIAASPDGRRVYVTDYGTPNTSGRSVSIIDTSTDTVVGTIGTTGVDPWGVAVSPDSRTLYVSETAGGTNAGSTIEVIDTVTLASTSIPVPTVVTSPDMALSPDGTSLVVLDFGTDQKPGRTVQVIDPIRRALVGSATLAGRPNYAAFSPDGTRAYVTTRDPDGVQVVRLR